MKASTKRSEGVKKELAKLVKEYLDYCDNHYHYENIYCPCGEVEGREKVKEPIKPSMHGFAEWLSK